MEIEKDKEYRINFDSNGRLFFYKGFIENEDENFLTINDRKSGLVRLNKKRILSILPFNGCDPND